MMFLAAGPIVAHMILEQQRKYPKRIDGVKVERILKRKPRAKK